MSSYNKLQPAHTAKHTWNSHDRLRAQNTLDRYKQRRSAVQSVHPLAIQSWSTDAVAAAADTFIIT